MPTAETLEKFIARVESNFHAEALAEFYTEDSSMQENQSPPRVGLAANIARERATLARATAVRSQCVRPAFVQGDHVAIRWIFEFDWLDGSSSRIEEIAWQRWSGERIVAEQFFYDPAQMAPKKPAAPAP